MKTYSISCILCILAALFPVAVLGFCFEDAGNTYGINPTLLESIARVESNLNPKAINRNTNGTSDIGLMQINSAWLKSISVNANDLLNDACLNAMTGAWILRQCVDRHGYGWEAVGCYNAMSRNKKVDYAWKIFHQLKNERNKSTGNIFEANNDLKEKRMNNLLAQKSTTPSLVFRVRDVTETERGAP
jgi:soluble lytic murein transglycosylase-like protein